MLRAARGLTAAGLSSTRILRSLRRLKSQLPERIPLAGLRIEAVGDAVVVSEGERQWQPENGQYVLGFTVASDPRGVSFIDAAAPSASPADADAWFHEAASLEEVDPDAACAAYRHAIEADPTYGPAYTNLGRILHQRGKLREAESVYRDGLAHCGPDGTVLFNLGVHPDRRRHPGQSRRVARRRKPQGGGGRNLPRGALSESPDGRCALQPRAALRGERFAPRSAAPLERVSQVQQLEPTARRFADRGTPLSPARRAPGRAQRAAARPIGA